MNIQELVFFKTNGTQIPIQYTQKLTFSLIGNMSERGDRGYGWRQDVEGYFVLDEKKNVLNLTVTNGGSTYGFNDSKDYTDAVLGLIDEMVVKFKTDEYQSEIFITKETGLFEIFEFILGVRKVAVRSHSEDNNIYEYFVKEIRIKDEYKSSFIETKFNMIPQGVKIYPSCQFLSQLMMEKVSTKLASTETVFILEYRQNSKGEFGYFRPRSESQKLRFQFPKDSDTKFVKTAEEFYSVYENEGADESAYDYSKVYWQDYAVFDLISEYEETEDSREPLMFTLGFVSEYEGCFQDTLTAMTIDNSFEELNPIGYMMVKNETVGEDERYRTLFANFGIPDPADYPNLFKEIESYEEGTDWKFINKKSKELFLSYKDIFPYVGTYKALMNAVAFLGYDDIYFKEWYKYFDGKQEGEVAYQSVDVNTMMPLQSKLARLGVNLEEFLKWKKLSQLSLIYLINQQDSEAETFESYEWVDGKKANIKRKVFQIPSTKAVYTYLNSQILTKLYALKEWLENYILNINCQIIDVAGEGVYFERYKQQAYVSPLYTNITAVKETNLTPVFGKVKGNLNLNLEYGKTEVPCTIKELEDRTTFNEFQDNKIIDEMKKVETSDGSVNLDDDFFTNDGLLNAQINWLRNAENYDSDEVAKFARTTLRGTSMTNNTPFEGVQYDLKTEVGTGALRTNVGFYTEEIDAEKGVQTVWKDCPLVVNENEIFVYGYRDKEVEFKVPPIIRITAGKLRKPFGKWERNALYSIQGFFDTERTKTRFALQSLKQPTQEVSDDYITFYPKRDADSKPSFKYTEKNKYGVPMFIMEDYDTFNGYLSSDTSVNKFIVEIDEGYIDSYEYVEGDEGNYCLARMKFEQDYNRNNANEQKICMEYTYKTPRASLDTVEYDDSADISVYISDYKSQYSAIEKKIQDVSALVFETSEFDAKSENVVLSDTRLLDIKNKLKEDNEMLSDGLDAIEKKIEKIESLKSTSAAILIPIYEWELAQAKELKSDFVVSEKAFQDNALVDFDALKAKWLQKLEIEKHNIAKNLNVLIADSKIRTSNHKYHNNVILNHVGEYELNVTATDGFNIPFVQKSLNVVKVAAAAPHVFVNTYEEEGSDYETKVERMDVRPWFVPEYFRTLKSVDREEGSFLYQDYSYFMDTPKKDDYIHLSNTTERVNDIDDKFEAKDCSLSNFTYEKSKGYVKIVMSDENPCHQNVFYIGAQLYLVYIDNNSCDLANVYTEEATNISRLSGPYTVAGYKNPYLRFINDNRELREEDDEQEEDDNYVILSYDTNNLDFTPIAQQMVDLMHTDDVACYAIMNTRMEIERENIFNDYEKRQCTIRIKDSVNGQNMLFSEGQCIMISYSSLTYFGLTDTANGQEAKINESYLSGTAYKVLKTHYNTNDFCQEYVIDGLVNTDLIDLRHYKNGVYNAFSETAEKNMLGVPYKIKCSISPAHWIYTKYDVMASEDADEDNSEGYVKFIDDWYGTDYLDNTFAFTMRKFKTSEAFDDWNTEFTQEDVLYAHSKPVTVYRDSVDETVAVMVNSFDLQNVIEDNEYMSVWNVYHNPGKDKEDEYLLYQLTNDQLTLKLKKEGEYRFQLTAIDKFGNKYVNSKQGFMKIVTRPQ